MADEHKETGEAIAVDTPDTDEKIKVELTQSKLDKLINEGYGKGANKAQKELLTSLGVDNLKQAKELIKAKKEADEASKSDLDKATDTISTLKETIKGLENSNKALTEDVTVNKVAMEHNIQDVDYFKHLRAIASKDEKFNETTFIETLKTNKPYLFNEKAKQKIDNSPNKNPTQLSEKIKGAKTMAELRALNV